MPIVNVKQAPFLAVGDGIVDDTLALRAAVAAAVASVHGAGDPAVVVFPPGVYRLTRDMSTPAGVRTLWSIELRGARDIELRAQAPGTATLLKDGDAGAGDWYALRLSGCERIRMHGLVFDGSKESNPDPAEQAHLIQIDGGCGDVVIRECLFRSSIGDGVRLLGEGTAWNRDVVVGNVLRDSSNVQVALLTLSGAHRCHVAHNRLSGPLTGHHVSDTVIEHNQIETAPAYSSVAVNFSGASDGVVFRGNLVRRVSDAVTGGTALQMIHHNGMRSVEAAIEGNVIDTNAAVAINIESVQQIRVSGNLILKMPTAADPRDVAINIRSHKTLEGVAIDAIDASGNHIVSGDVPWSIGIQLTARPAVLDAAVTADNVHSRSDVPLVRHPI